MIRGRAEQGRAAIRIAAMTAGVLSVLACGETDTVRPTNTLTAADSADQILVGMEHLITTAGVRRTRVLADTAYVYEASQLLRLKVVKVTFLNESGLETSTVVSDSGLYHTRDGSMSAFGNVFASTPDGRRLRSEELVYDARTEEISSSLPYTYDRGDQHYEGNGFTSDPDFRNVKTRQLRGGATGADSAKSGGFLLPGQ